MAVDTGALGAWHRNPAITCRFGRSAIIYIGMAGGAIDMLGDDIGPAAEPPVNAIGIAVRMTGITCGIVLADIDIDTEDHGMIYVTTIYSMDMAVKVGDVTLRTVGRTDRHRADIPLHVGGGQGQVVAASSSRRVIMTGVATGRVVVLRRAGVRCGHRVRSGGIGPWIAVMATGTVGVGGHPGCMIHYVIVPGGVDRNMTTVTVLVGADGALTGIDNILRSKNRCTRVHINGALVAGQTVAGAGAVGGMQLNTGKGSQRAMTVAAGRGGGAALGQELVMCITGIVG
ncbi:MAG: hypothetical protein RQ753_05805 [Desulfurivibrionaceae bacterium]|nr:hypothetical protein [Desulfurivibrionaceae bacterium]